MRNPNKTPRRAFCTGCTVTFPKMHLMINHRRTFRCGGRFLSREERSLNTIVHHMMTMGYSEMSNSFRIDRDRIRHDRLQETRRIKMSDTAEYRFDS